MTNPTLMDNVSITQGLSDHDIVLAKDNAKPEITKQVPCTIPLHKKAYWGKLKQSMRDLYSELKHCDLAITSVQKYVG